MAFYSRNPIRSTDDLESETLTQLYGSGKLDASIAQPAIFPPSKTLNDQVILVQMDMTRMAIDAIVNAANKSLLGGGGIDGAIHRAAGMDLYRECLDLHGCDTGDAKITKGYRLPAKHVIHTVGPVYYDHKDEGRDPAPLLKSCYVKSLDVARRAGCKSVAFPCISTGIYGYPGKKAAEVACNAVREYLEAQLQETLFGEKEEDKKVELKEEKVVIEGKDEEGKVKKEEEEEKKDVKPAEGDGKVAVPVEDAKEEKPKEIAETKDEKPEGEAAITTAEDNKQATKEEDKEATKEEDKEAIKDDEDAEPPFLCKIEKVIFCIFLDKDLETYEDIVPAFFPPADEEVEGALDKLDRETSENPPTVLGGANENEDNNPVEEQPKDAREE
ncbi:hypothetical protein TWF281_010675 [Arthrobotrys megalospora]